MIRPFYMPVSIRGSTGHCALRVGGFTRLILACLLALGVGIVQTPAVFANGETTITVQARRVVRERTVVMPAPQVEVQYVVRPVQSTTPAASISVTTGSATMTAGGQATPSAEYRNRFTLRERR